MCKFHKIIRLMALALSFYTQAEPDHSLGSEIQTTPDDVIFIVTDNEKCPKGEYWPSHHNTYDQNGQQLNTSIVKVCDETYIGIIESFDFLAEDNYIYLGSFTNSDGQTVYLYDEKDTNNENVEIDE